MIVNGADERSTRRIYNLCVWSTMLSMTQALACMACASVVLTYDVIAVNPRGMHVVRGRWCAFCEWVMSGVDLAWTYDEIIDRFYTGGRCTDSISLAVQQRRVDTCDCAVVSSWFWILVVWVECYCLFCMPGQTLGKGWRCRKHLIYYQLQLQTL